MAAEVAACLPLASDGGFRASLTTQQSQVQLSEDARVECTAVYFDLREQSLRQGRYLLLEHSVAIHVPH